MSLTVTENKQFKQTAEQLFSAAKRAIMALEGKIHKEDANSKQLEAKFDKKILGKVLGERTHLEVEITAASEGSTLALTAYPLNAVGQKLMFGARKGVTQTVVSWFWAHVDNQ
ncbi:MAG: hypothetical protein KDE51_05260, partial [Anaerolineales bacterium]|nr:hypothetical protein [Anaerolineales bacterium]